MSAGGLSTIPPYSVEATVAAVQDYFALLTDMYLSPTDVLTPPTGGWPGSTINRLQCMGKTTAVLDLLAHLPYIRGEEDDGPQAGMPGCHFADWRHIAETTSSGPDDDTGPNGHDLRECSEPVELVEREVIPPYVVGLTYGGRENPTFLLDTKRGIVHWYECPNRIRYDHTLPRAVTDVDDPSDWDDMPEEEAEWRTEHPAWSVVDFFEILKRQLIELRYVPVGSPARAVLYSDDEDAEEELGELVAAVREVYRRHRWGTDRGSFDKVTCLREVKRLVMEEYPDHDYLYDEDEEEGDEEGNEDEE